MRVVLQSSHATHSLADVAITEVIITPCLSGFEVATRLRSRTGHPPCGAVQPIGICDAGTLCYLLRTSTDIVVTLK